MKIVRVEWIDSCFRTGWNRKDALKQKPASCETVGFLMSKNKEAIVIASSISDDDCADGITIPIKCIKTIKNLDIQGG